MRRLNPACIRICVATLLALTASVSPTAFAQAPASPLSEAQSLLQQGQQSQALDRVERALAANPKDRQARFLKGVILAEMNKLDDAAAVFVKLTEDAPELPEPYNNLAVIYAQQKQYDKAKSALEMAIRTHPSYAVAHENLGDLYAKMARQAYDRALQIDSSNTNAQAKLNLLRDLTSASTRPAASKPVIVAAATPAPKPVAAPPAAPAPAIKPAAPVQSVPPAAALPASPAARSSAAPAAATPTPPAANKPTPAATDDNKKEVRTAVQAWAAAWSNKNAKEYLSYYAKDFQVPDKKGRKAWEEERTQRVTKPGQIKVSLSELDIRVDGDHATARFKQHYDSTTFNSASGKTLELVQRNGRWQIQQERIGR